MPLPRPARRRSAPRIVGPRSASSGSTPTSSRAARTRSGPSSSPCWSTRGVSMPAMRTTRSATASRRSGTQRRRSSSWRPRSSSTKPTFAAQQQRSPRRVRSLGLGRAVRALPRGRREPAPPGASATPGDRAAARVSCSDSTYSADVTALDPDARTGSSASSRSAATAGRSRRVRAEAKATLAPPLTPIAPRWLATRAGDRPAIRRGVRRDRGTRRIRRSRMSPTRILLETAAAAEPGDRARASPRALGEP